MEFRAFIIHGEPVGKARARVVRRQGAVRAYTPEKTANFETLIQVEYRQSYGALPPIEGPLRVAVAAFFRTPKAYKRPALDGMDDTEAVRCTRRPDADNVSKLCLDALNGLAWKDDAQVSDLVVRKRYSLRPRVEIRIEAAR